LNNVSIPSPRAGVGKQWTPVMNHNPPESFLTITDVVARTTLSRAYVYDAARAGNFPAPIRISANRVAWRATQIDAWIAAKIGKAA
jgi:prophage regulatory protein